MHLLEQEIELLAESAGAVEQFRELLQMAAQAIEFFADVAALGEQSGFLRKASRLDAAAAQQFLQPILQSPRECRRQADRAFSNFFGFVALLFEARKQLPRRDGALR